MTGALGNIFGVGSGLYSLFGRGATEVQAIRDRDLGEFLINRAAAGTDVLGLIMTLRPAAIPTPVIAAGLTALSAAGLTLGESVQSLETGHGFVAGKSSFEEIGGTLEQAYPTDDWEGSGSRAYTRQNTSQQDRASTMAEADGQMAGIISKEADQVDQTRQVLRGAAVGLGVAIPVAVALNAIPVVGTAKSLAFQTTVVATAAAASGVAMARMAALAAANAIDVQQVIALYEQVAAQAQPSGSMGDFSGLPPGTRTETDKDAPKDPPKGDPKDQSESTSPGTEPSSPGTSAPTGGSTPSSGGGGAPSGGGSPSSSGGSSTGGGTPSADTGSVPSSSIPTTSVPGVEQSGSAGAGAGGAAGGMLGSLGGMLGGLGQQVGQVAQTAGQVPQQAAQMGAQAAQQAAQMAGQSGTESESPWEIKEEAETVEPLEQEAQEASSQDSAEFAQAEGGAGERAPIEAGVGGIAESGEEAREGVESTVVEPESRPEPPPTTLV